MHDTIPSRSVPPLVFLGLDAQKDSQQRKIELLSRSLCTMTSLMAQVKSRYSSAGGPAPAAAAAVGGAELEEPVLLPASDAAGPVAVGDTPQQTRRVNSRRGPSEIPSQDSVSPRAQLGAQHVPRASGNERLYEGGIARMAMMPLRGEQLSRDPICPPAC